MSFKVKAHFKKPASPSRNATNYLGKHFSHSLDSQDKAQEHLTAKKVFGMCQRCS